MALSLPDSNAVDRTQARFFEAIRLTVDLVEAVYARLQESATELARAPVFNPQEAGQRGLVMADAYALLDGAARLRAQLDATPGLRRNATGMVELAAALEPCDRVRRTVANLYRDLDHLGPDGPTIWGMLTWWVPAPDRRSATTHTLTAGACTRAVEVLPPDPSATAVELPAGRFVLRVAGAPVDLSALVAAIALFALRLERATRLAFEFIPDGVLDAEAEIVVTDHPQTLSP